MTAPLPSIEDFKPLIRNSLRGFARVRLPSGMIVDEVSIHVSNGKAWASPPSKPQVGKDGAATTIVSDESWSGAESRGLVPPEQWGLDRRSAEISTA